MTLFLSTPIAPQFPSDPKPCHYCFWAHVADEVLHAPGHQRWGSQRSWYLGSLGLGVPFARAYRKIGFCIAWGFQKLGLPMTKMVITLMTPICGNTLLASAFACRWLVGNAGMYSCGSASAATFR